MTIGKYSLIKMKGENKIGYVEDVVDGLLRLSFHGSLVALSPDIELVKLPEDISTKDLVQVEHQLKIIAGVYAVEKRRRIYDIEKHGMKSKYFADDFTI